MDVNLIFLTETGSRLYGTSTPESDTDTVGVRVETMRQIAGFHGFEQEIVRTAGTRDGGKDHAPSLLGDSDSTVYGLRKFLRLAADGNPNVLELFYAPRDKALVMRPLAHEMLDLAPYLASKQAGRKFLGYIRGQKRKLSVGTLGMTNESRMKLREEHGYDTKYAGHIFRLAYQGIRLMREGHMVLPLPEAEEVLRIRNGSIKGEHVFNVIEDQIAVLEEAIEKSALPDKADRQRVEDWLLDAYDLYWGRSGQV